MNKSRLGLCGGLVALGISVVAAGTATAAGSTYVVSDNITFSGHANRMPGTGTYFLSVSYANCVVNSDTEPMTQCQFFAQFNTSSSGVVTGTATLSSSDGTTQWNFTFTQPSPITFLMKGKCTEMDNPDSGQPTPPQYPCKAKAKGDYHPDANGFTLAGSMVVKEFSNQP